MELQNSIKQTVLSVLPNAKVLLFGSRAKGNYTALSDYDFLVVTENDLPLNEKRDFAGKIRRALIALLNAPVDVLINSREEISKKKLLPGHVIKQALNEGIEL